MRLSIKETIMQRDELTSEEADSLIAEAKEALEESVMSGDLELAEEVIADYFGLEPDYLDELLF